MRRATFAVLSWCIIAVAAALAGPAHAGDYYRYDDGYAYRSYPRNTRVWYSSSCCYRRIVRHQTTVRYVPVRRYGYEGRPYRYGYDRRPYRYSTYAPRYRYSDYPYYRSYTVSNYSDGCYTRRVRVPDGYGGWYWGARRVCY